MWLVAYGLWLMAFGLRLLAYSCWLRVKVRVNVAKCETFLWVRVSCGRLNGSKVIIITYINRPMVCGYSSLWWLRLKLNSKWLKQSTEVHWLMFTFLRVFKMNHLISKYTFIVIRRICNVQWNVMIGLARWFLLVIGNVCIDLMHMTSFQ